MWGQPCSQEQDGAAWPALVVSMGLWPWCGCALSVCLSVRPGYVHCFTSLPLELFLTGVEKQGPLICALSCVN